MDTDNSTENPKNDAFKGIETPRGAPEEDNCTGAIVVRPVGAGVAILETTFPSQGMAPMHGRFDAATAVPVPVGA